MVPSFSQLRVDRFTPEPAAFQSHEPESLTGILDLPRFCRNNFGNAPILRYLPGYANFLVDVIHFRISKFHSVRPPNDNSENLSWIRGVEVYESRLSF